MSVPDRTLRQRCRLSRDAGIADSDHHDMEARELGRTLISWCLVRSESLTDAGELILAI